MLHLFHHPESPLKKYVAEGLGALTLTLGVMLSGLSNFPVATPVVAAFIVGMFVYTIGRISGAHLNPAVTVALLSVGKINRNDAFAYIVSQCIGAVIAMLLGAWLLPELPSPVIGTTPQVAFAEMIGAFVLVFGISAVVQGKLGESAAGIVIGSSLLVGILLAVGAGSNGILNPAVALGVGALSVFYIVAPLLGAMLGAWTYWWISADARPSPAVPPRR